MALTRVQYTQTGSGTVDFLFPIQYISKDHVKAYVNGTSVPFSWSSDNVITLDSAPAVGSFVELRRETEDAFPLVDFQDGSTITEDHLDLSAKQGLNLAQEAMTEAKDGIKRGKTSAASSGWDAQSLPLKNIGTPTEAFDAVTKQYLESNFRYEVDQDLQAITDSVAAVGDDVTTLADSLTTTNNNLSTLSTDVDSLAVAVTNNKGEKGDPGLAGPTGPYFDLDVTVALEDDSVSSNWDPVWLGSQSAVHLPQPNAGLYLLKGLYNGTDVVAGTVNIPFDLATDGSEATFPRVGGSVYTHGSDLILAHWFKDYGFKLSVPNAGAADVPVTQNKSFTTNADPYDTTGFISTRGATTYMVSGGGLKPKTTTPRILVWDQVTTEDVIKSSIVMGQGNIFSDYNSPSISTLDGKCYYCERNGSNILVYYWSGTAETQLTPLNISVASAAAGAVVDFIYTRSTDTLSLVYNGTEIYSKVGTNLTGDLYLGMYMYWGNSNAAFITSWTGEGYVESTTASVTLTEIFKQSQATALNAVTTVTKTLVSSSGGAIDPDPTNPSAGVFNYSFSVAAEPYVGNGLTTLVGTGGYSVISGLRPATTNKMHLAYNTVTLSDSLEASITVVNGESSSDVFSPALWRSDGTGYFMERVGTALHLKTYSSGTYTTLTTYSGGPIAVTASDVLTVRLTRSTSTVSFLYNGTAIFSVAGSSLASDLYLGIYLALGNTAPSYVSDFTVSGYLEDEAAPPPPPAAVITEASAVGISSTEIEIDFRSISAGQYWLQKRLTSGTQWADFAQVTVASNTLRKVVSGGNSAETSYTFRIFGPSGETSADFTATTLEAVSSPPTGGGGGSSAFTASFADEQTVPTFAQATHYASPTATVNGSGTLGSPWTFAQAMANAVAGNIVGLLPGKWYGTEPVPAGTERRLYPAFRPENSGTASNPIWFVAQNPANTNSTGRTEIYSGASTAWQGWPAFGAYNKDYIRYVGIYSDENDPNGQIWNDCGLATIREATGLGVYKCHLVGKNNPNDNNAGVRVEGSFKSEIADNLIEGFIGHSNSVPATTGGVNNAGVCSYRNEGLRIHHNEIRDCLHAVHIKTKVNGFRYYNNKIKTCKQFIRVSTPGYTKEEDQAWVYNNIADYINFIFESTSSDGIYILKKLKLFNNTFNNVTRLSNDPAAIWWAVGPSNIDRDNAFFNNIIHTAKSYMGSYQGSPSSPAALANFIKADRNVFHSITDFFNGGGMENYTVADWQAVGQDVNSVFANPSFTDRAAGDFTLQPTSPAINLGRDLLGQFGAVGATVNAGARPLSSAEVIGIRP